MNKFFVLSLFCLTTSISWTQDVINNYISEVKFRMSKVYNHLPTSDCNPEDPLNVEEWRFKAQVSDSPNDDGLGWTDDGCYQNNVEGTGWTTYPNFQFYYNDWTSPNRTSMDYALQLTTWEDDINPDCDMQNGDQCRWPSPETLTYQSLPKGSCEYPGEWNSWVSGFGSSTRYINVEYYYEIDPFTGYLANYANTFQFETIDASGCPSVYHCMNNENRSGMNTYYSFILDNQRRIAIDLTDQPGNLQMNLFATEGEAGGGSNPIQPYSTSTDIKNYDLLPGTYYIRVSRTTAVKGNYRLSIYSDNSGPYYWNGSVSSDWHDVDNWSSCVLPTLSIQVIIPYTSSNQPIIYTGNTGQCQSIEIDNSTKVTIQSGALLNTNN